MSLPGFSPRRRKAGFTLSEMMIVVGLLVLFAAASIVTLMVTNSAAMAARNKTLIRAEITERMNEIMALSTVQEVNNEPIVLWQIAPNGENVQIDGTMTIDVSEDEPGLDTQKVTITFNYEFAGREIEHQMVTLKNTAPL